MDVHLFGKIFFKKKLAIVGGNVANIRLLCGQLLSLI